MQRQVLFIQGAGDGTHDAWDSKLVESLANELGKQFLIRYPRMPNEGDPRYLEWKIALLDELEGLDAGAIVVGHSLGGTVLANVLSEHAPVKRLDAVMLIAAPFLGGGGWHSDEIEPLTPLAGRLPADVPVFLYHGTADADVPFEHLALYAEAIPQAIVRALSDRDHQLNNDLSAVARDIRAVLRPR